MLIQIDLFYLCVFMPAAEILDERSEVGHPRIASPLMQIEGLLSALTNANQDGRVIIQLQGTSCLYITL